MINALSRLLAPERSDNSFKEVCDTSDVVKIECRPVVTFDRAVGCDSQDHHVACRDRAIVIRLRPSRLNLGDWMALLHQFSFLSSWCQRWLVSLLQWVKDGFVQFV